MLEEKFIIVEKSPALERKVVTIQGSKNSALGIVAAACLNDAEVQLNNVPDLRDFRIIREMLRKNGIKFEMKEDYCLVDSSNCSSYQLDYAITADFRASYYFIAPILKKFKKVSLAFPGGDDFVSRPIDQHFKGIKKLGGIIEESKDQYTVYADKLIGNDIHFDLITSGGTMNIMLISTLAEGRTVMTNCATDPEVVDLAKLLNKMGHRIVGAGTHKITIYPSKTKVNKKIVHTVIPDRLIAGTFLMLPGIVGGEITISNAVPEHLESLIYTLEEMGLQISYSKEGLTSKKIGPLTGHRCVTGMYPLFATDLQQPLTALMLYSNTDSSVQDNVYYHRFSHVEELSKLGVDLVRKDNIAYVKGNSFQKLKKGVSVNCRDVRAGTCLLLTALGIDGETRLYDIKHLLRGYEDIVGELSNLGMKIRFSS